MRFKGRPRESTEEGSERATMKQITAEEFIFICCWMLDSYIAFTFYCHKREILAVYVQHGGSERNKQKNVEVFFYHFGGREEFKNEKSRFAFRFLKPWSAHFIREEFKWKKRRKKVAKISLNLPSRALIVVVRLSQLTWERRRKAAWARSTASQLIWESCWEHRKWIICLARYQWAFHFLSTPCPEARKGSITSTI